MYGNSLSFIFLLIFVYLHLFVAHLFINVPVVLPRYLYFFLSIHVIFVCSDLLRSTNPSSFNCIILIVHACFFFTNRDRASKLIWSDIDFLPCKINSSQSRNSTKPNFEIIDFRHNNTVVLTFIKMMSKF